MVCEPILIEWSVTDDSSFGEGVAEAGASAGFSAGFASLSCARTPKGKPTKHRAVEIRTLQYFEMLIATSPNPDGIRPHGETRNCISFCSEAALLLLFQ